MRGRANISRKLTAIVAAGALVLSMSPVQAFAWSHSWSPSAPSSPSYDAEPTDWDYLEPIEHAGVMIEQQDWTVESDAVTDVETLRAWLEARLEAMELPDVILHVKLDAADFVAAVDGTAELPEGIQGSFNAEVEITRSPLGWTSKHVPISGTIVPAPYVAPKPTPTPTPEQQVAKEIEEAIAAQIVADPDSWTVDQDDLDDIDATDEEAVKASVKIWVAAKLAPMVPEGFSHEIGEPEVVLPTEEEAGSFACPVFLTAEEPLLSPADTVESAASAAAMAAVATPQIIMQPQSLMMRASRTAAVEPVREPSLLIKGTIAPRGVKVPSEPDDPSTTPGGDDQDPQPDDGTGNGSGNGSGSQDGEEPKDNRTPIHPLALRTMDPADNVTIINTATQLDRSRVVKRPNQIDGEEAPPSMSSTAVQRGSSIAPTSDQSQSATAAGIVICVLAVAVIAVCIRQLRHKGHGHKSH